MHLTLESSDIISFDKKLTIKNNLMHHTIEKENEKQFTEFMWVLLSIYVIIHVGIGLFHLLHVHLGRKIAIHQIIKLKKWDDGESNTLVELTMKSNKHKILTFRSLEKEHERFIECVKQLNPEIKVN